MQALEYIFWVGCFLLVYPYLIYPLILRITTAVRGANEELAVYTTEWPAVTFIISAFNEASVIEEKLRNTIGLDYPDEKLNVIVISDASDDGTDDIVNRFSAQHPNVQLVRQEQRKGKTAGLNLGMNQATGEIVVFSDANAMYKDNAVRELVKYFANGRVGYVMGAALYNDAGDNEANQSEGLYWQFELYLKELETRFHSVVGGDGAIYAIRRELFWELQDDDINDFVNPLQIVSRGYRGLFNSDAICYEDSAEEFEKEFKRKRRIVNRSWRAVKRYIGWFNWIKQAKFLFQLISHKIIRWYSIVFLLAMIISSFGLVLTEAGPIYNLAFAGLLASVAAALIGSRMDNRGHDIPKLIYLPYYFYMVNVAALQGIMDEARGETHTTWDHVRGGVNESAK